MGTTISSVFNRLFGKKEMRILMVGLEDAGKTTILYTLKLGEIVHAVPTVHINVETLDYKNISLTIWDCSGRPRIRPLLRHYYQNTQGIIFVVDSSDTENIDEVKYLVTNMLLEDELKDAAILVFANKQDMPNAISVDELTKALELNNLRNRRCYVQASCATQGEGLYEGLDWLSNELAMK